MALLSYMSRMKSAASVKLSIFSTTYESENARYSFNFYYTAKNKLWRQVRYEHKCKITSQKGIS